MSEKIEITIAELENLQRAQAMLSALEAAGVDNWDFYDDALSEFRQAEAKSAIIKQAGFDIVEFLCSDAHIYEPAGRGAGYTIELVAKSQVDFECLIKKIIEDYNGASK